MKFLRPRIKLAVLFLMLFIFGCSSQVVNSVTLPSSTKTEFVNSSVSKPASTTSPMPFLVQTVTNITIPTLPLKDAQSKIIDLLDNNGNCELPCLWGITPGKSSFQDARTILLPLSVLSSQVYLSTPEVGGISLSINENNMSVYNNLRFLTDTQSNLINRISFYLEAHRNLVDGGYEKIYNSSVFGEQARFYELASILSEFGVPNSVMVGTLAGNYPDGGSWGFHILLLYPEEGVLVDYTTQMILDGQSVKGCPSNAHVALELFPPGTSDEFYRNLESTNYWSQNINNNYKSLQDVTPLTTEQFYENFRRPTDKCIETPVNLWPAPSR